MVVPEVHGYMPSAEAQQQGASALSILSTSRREGLDARSVSCADFDPEAGDLAQGAQLDDFDEDVLPLDPRSAHSKGQRAACFKPQYPRSG